MNVRPLHDRLLVRRIEEKETVKGGIIIPDLAENLIKKEIEKLKAELQQT